MSVAFPLSPAPSWYTQCSFPTRNGIFYSDGTGGAPRVTLSKSGATAYSVRDYTGAVVSSGSVSGTALTPTAPSGGWPCGWYRLYLTGPSTDALFGSSYGATNFVVIPNDSRFPANPAVATAGAGSHGEAPDYVTKGVLGIGTSRITVDNAAAPTSGSSDNIAESVTSAGLSTTYWVNQADGARPRRLWCNLPNGGFDRLILADTGGGTYLNVYCKDETVDGATVFVQASAGTNSGTKIRVFHPDSATLAETYDNLASSAAAATAVNGSSALVRSFAGGQVQQASASGPTAIGSAYSLGVKQVVTALYPTVKCFEGPVNEPGERGAELALMMRLFAAAVHAGNPSAKAIGPSCVNLEPDYWDSFLAAGGGSYCDEFAFHDYSGILGGNLPLGRSVIAAWLNVIAKYGQQGKVRWQTEAGQAFKSVYGVHHPRRAVWKLLQVLLWEQYGVPAERNTPWYDMSHGFWSFPAWLINSDTSLNAEAPMLRTLTAETYGKTFSSALSFGTWGDAIVVGNLYAGADGTSTVAVCAATQMPSQSVTLTITGATAPLTAVDAWGNVSTVAIGGGRVTVPVGAQPTYLRLPAGATAAAYSVGDWPAIGVRGQGFSTAYLAAATGGRQDILDSAWMTSYGTDQGTYSGPTPLPDTFTLSWPRPVRLDRVLIWNAMSWQGGASLLDFDVQTSTDGSAWTTRQTVTKTTSSFKHGTDFSGVGCQYETYWDEQWIFDVKLPTPVTAQYLRLNVRAASYGGEPDANALAAGGQGGPPRIVLQEIAVLCDDNVRPQYVTR